MAFRILGPAEVGVRPSASARRVEAARLAVLLLHANEVVGGDVLKRSAPGGGADRPTRLLLDA